MSTIRGDSVTASAVIDAWIDQRCGTNGEEVRQEHAYNRSLFQDVLSVRERSPDACVS